MLCGSCLPEFTSVWRGSGWHAKIQETFVVQGEHSKFRENYAREASEAVSVGGFHMSGHRRRVMSNKRSIYLLQGTTLPDFFLRFPRSGSGWVECWLSCEQLRAYCLDHSPSLQVFNVSKTTYEPCFLGVSLVDVRSKAPSLCESQGGECDSLQPDRGDGVVSI